MKHFYSRCLPFAIKTVLIPLALFAISITAGAQNYWVSLSGPAEAPPNNSPGTGRALITIDVAANTLRIQTNFSGLLAGVTAAHIHAATAVPGTGTAGVATALPTFPGFPSAVMAGSYDQTFNMLMASSYNPSYITNNGGTPASAFTALRAAIDAGRAYLNIHSTMFPGGEIRGFLTLCPAINVSIPDAFALGSGVQANTVYPAYAPASSLTLQANVSGGVSPYSYSWSNGATTSTITVSPATMTAYTVSVTDQNGCPGSATKTVHVTDVSGGNKGDKIVVCHGGHGVTIATAAVASHLQHGDMLGGCEPSTMRVPLPAIEEDHLAIKVMGNPSSLHFDIQLRGKAAGNIQMMIYDNLGRMIESRSSLASNQTIRIGASYQPGVYLVEIVQGTEKKVLKLVKSN